ncbi:MAG: hypothetical protein AAGC67_20055 [Myxococcota bacterium]
MISRLLIAALALLLAVASFATSANTLTADPGTFSHAVAGRYEGDEAFLLLVTETRFGEGGTIEERSFDCITDVALTVADGAAATRMGTGVCERDDARVLFEIVGSAQPDGIEAEIRLDYAGVETALPLATELVEAGLGADFSGRSDRIGDRQIAFNGTFAARRR